MNLFDRKIISEIAKESKLPDSVVMEMWELYGKSINELVVNAKNAEESDFDKLPIISIPRFGKLLPIKNKIQSNDKHK